MRNLKRALSLTLASVMLLGMMVVGAGAAGFPDVDKEDNVEAIEVLNAVEVILGYDNGDFGPDDLVTRAQMAVIMAKLLNLDYQYYEATCPFTDVPEWARGYVGACYAKGITSGYSATTYGPNDSITPVQAASMMMRALGYFQYSQDYSAGFEVATVSQGTDIGIFNGVGSSATAAMTRDQVAQMALNALRSNVVTFTGTPGMEVNGVTVGYRAEYTPRTSPETKYNAITSLVSDIANTNQYYIQLGEQLYDGKLRLNDGDIDPFGRPARTWEFNGKKIGTYVKSELLRGDVYSTKVTGADLYERLTQTTIDTYKFLISVDGETEKSVLNPDSTTNYGYFTTADMYRTNKDGVGNTGKGVTTEVYVDTNNKQVYIAVINTYLAIAAEDYDEKNDDVDLTVYNIKQTASKSGIYVKAADDETIKVEGADFNIEDVKDGDKFLVTVADGEIQTMETPEIISSATINAFKLNSWVKTGSEQYDHASTARYDEEVLVDYDLVNLKEVTFNIILDQYGYLIGLEQNEDPDQYVFLTGIDKNYSQLTTRSAKANVIFLDGRMDTVEVNVKDSVFETDNTKPGYFADKPSQANTWCTYTVSNDGVYTLVQVPVSGATSAISAPDRIKVAQYAQDVTSGTTVIDQKHVSLKGADANYMVYGNDETVYLNLEVSNIEVSNGDWKTVIDDVESVNTGVKNVKINVVDGGATYTDANHANADYNVPEIYPLYKDNGFIIAVATIGENEGVASNYAYIVSSNLDQEEYGHPSSSRVNEGDWAWSREVVINGELTKLYEEGDHLKYLANQSTKYPNGVKQGEWYEVKFDANGYVRKAEPITYSNGDTKFIDKVINAEKTSEKFDTVLLCDTTTVEKLTWSDKEVGTLYTDNAQSRGFSVSPSVKVVLCLANKNAENGQFDDCEDKYVGYKGVQDALRDMNATPTYRTLSTDGGTREVEVSAILENGVATTIVINDKVAPDTKRPGNGDQPGELPDPFWNGTAIEVPYYKTIPSTADLKASLEPVIGTIKTMSMSLAITEDGMYYPVALKEYIAIKLDGVAKEYTPVSASSWTKDITGLTNGVVYLKDTKYSTATAIGSNGYTVSGGKITVGDSSATSQTDVELYTAYKITLTANVTASDGTNSMTNTDNHYVATGTEVTFTGTATSGRHAFVVNDETRGASDKANAELAIKITEDTSVDETTSYKVSILGTDYGDQAAGAKIVFTSTAPAAGIVAKVNGTLQGLNTNVSAASDTREYTVNASDAHTDGTITIVEAYKVATQTETAIDTFGLTWTAGQAISDTLTKGTTLVEVGTKVYVGTSADPSGKKIMVAPGITGIAGFREEGVDDDGYAVYSFTMPKAEVAAGTFCFDKYKIASQTNDVATFEYSTDGGTTKTAVTPGTTEIPVGATVYVTAKADDKTIIGANVTLSEVTAPGATTKGVWSFTMPGSGVVAGEFSQS